MQLQSLNLRAAIFRCLNEFKKNGILGRDVIVRKTLFDNCKGERIQELLVSFSTLVLRKVLAAGQNGRPCIAARLATAENFTAKEQQSFLPLAVAHRASLTAVLQKKKDLRERYKNFGRILNAKEQELDQRFEAVVSTQDLLDKNPIPDHTVARVSKLFAKNWQGNRTPVEAITQGEEQGMKDALLDQPFSEIWQQVSAGTFDGATGTSWQGLLQDLEERVANQEARLTDWRNFREAMKRDEHVISADKITNSKVIKPRSEDTDHQEQADLVLSPRKSPKKSKWKVGKEETQSHPKRSRKENTQDELKERDLVFSPRKSPRKSMWPIDDLGTKTSPAHSRAALEQETEIKTPPSGSVDSISEKPVQGQLFEVQNGDTAKFSTQGSSVDDTDEPGFSAITDGQLHSKESQDHTVNIDHSDPTQHLDQNEASSTTSHGKDKSKKSEIIFSDIPTIDSNPTTTGDDDSWISSLPVESKQEERIESQSPDDDDKLAEQIVSMTINAPPTPANPKASLMERTRQSMAFASPMGLQNLLPEKPLSTPFSPIQSKPPDPTADPKAPTTLLERTRQSISLVPSKPKGSRTSTFDRRTSTSKPCPTNQFETPKRQLERVTELTPPEELFSPGAGYDSVFKSRPKIALSPNPSPGSGGYAEMDDGEGEGGGGGVGVGKGKGQSRREESRLARRMTAKV